MVLPVPSRAAAIPQSASSITLADHACDTGDGSIPKRTCVNYDPTTPTTPDNTPTPAAAAAPTISAAQAAQQAWHTQPLATPHVTIQPTGTTTLTGLPTYFHATFPGPGLAPNQTTTVTLLGHTLTLRPTNTHYTYIFGDGTTTGPTTDPGGPYPQGHITHTYPTKTTVTTRIDLTVTGEYQENGGPWQPIPGTTTLTGTPQTLTIATMQSRLHH